MLAPIPPLQRLRRAGLATLLVALLAALGPGLGVPSAQAAEPTRLDAGWAYAPASGSRPQRPPRRGWVGVTVPHVFSALPAEALYRGDVGWYRLRLRAPSREPAGGWNLRFEGARRTAAVWLNGRRLLAASRPYEPFELRARGLRPGRRNELLVRVNNHGTPDVREGWWNWGGLTRPVSLVPVDRVELRDVAVLPDVRCEAGACAAGVRVTGTVRNRSSRPLRARVQLRLKTPSGRVLSWRARLGRLAPGRRRAVRLRRPIDGAPELWTPEQPQLHSAAVEVLDGTRLVGRHRVVMGLRSVRVREGHLELNGRRLRLRGASIHEDVPGRGPALRDEDADRIVADLQALGANVTRAHYALDHRLLSRLDRAGILVWNQAPIYHADELLARRGGVRRALSTLRAAVRGARQHPSVIVHSVANELADEVDRRPASRRYVTKAAAAVRRLDPSVPVALDVMSRPNVPRQATYDAVDALGLNQYFGWYLGRGSRSTADFAMLEPYLATMRATYPAQAHVMTEFGAEADREGPSELKGTFGFQTGHLSRTLDVVDRTPGLDGAIYWTLREFAIRPRWQGGASFPGEPRDTIHNKGLLTYAGVPKPAWHLAQARFRAP